MYTDAMGRAFHSLAHHEQKGFNLQIIESEPFIEIRASEKSFMRLVDEDKRRALEYMVRVKKAFEENGAIVLLVREGGKE